jgi:GT2 family glycosyltransferase
MSKIYIILPVHNRVEITRSFLECLKRQTHNNYHLILIDDGCTDTTVEITKKLVPNLDIVKGDGSLWWGGSLHEAYLHLKEKKIYDDDFVLIANDDTRFSNDFIETGISLLRDKTKTLLLARAFSEQRSCELDRGIHINWPLMTFKQAERNDEINCLSTRGLFLKAKDYLSLDGFLPHKLPHYCSDYEFTIRASRQGYNLCTNESLRLYVNEETTGVHSIKFQGFSKYVETLFSIRSAKNPRIMSNFVLLCAPKWSIPFSLTRIWIGAFVRMLLSSVRDRC